MADIKTNLKTSLVYVNKIISDKPQICIILGSGLGYFGDELDNSTSISAKDIPFLPESTVPGHAGKWVFGTVGERNILALQGRIHYYEGYSITQIGYPIHLLAQMGIKNLIITTACGGINKNFSPGELMVITDHINFGFTNPLISPCEEQLGSRFPDMFQPYDHKFIQLAEKASLGLGIPLKRGVFCWVCGPNYETKAEINMLRIIGADVVSMSAVPEVIVANQRGMRVLGISCITNLVTGQSQNKLAHSEVLQTAERVRPKFSALIKEIIKRIVLVEGN